MHSVVHIAARNAKIATMSRTASWRRGCCLLDSVIFWCRRITSTHASMLDLVEVYISVCSCSLSPAAPVLRAMQHFPMSMLVYLVYIRGVARMLFLRERALGTNNKKRHAVLVEIAYFLRPLLSDNAGSPTVRRGQWRGSGFFFVEYDMLLCCQSSFCARQLIYYCLDDMPFLTDVSAYAVLMSHVDVEI